MTLKKLVILLTLVVYQATYAQPPLDWVEGSTNANLRDYIEDVYVDAAGNTYACGTFKGSMTIGSDNLFASSGGQAFAVKYDPSGNPLWAVQSQGMASDHIAYAKSIFADAAGNVYIAGYHSHGILLWAGLSVISNSNEGFYIVKLSPGGVPMHLTGPTMASTGKSQAWAIDGDGPFVYVSGSHRGALSLPGGPALPVTQGLGDVFVARVDSSLSSFTYAVSHGGPSEDIATGIDVSGVNLFVTGNYGAATCTFNAGTNYVLPNYGHQSAWLTGLTKATGVVNWATSAGSANGPTRSNDVQINGGQLYIVGACSDATTFVENPLFTGPFVYDDTLFSNGGLDAFVARYNSVGGLQTEWNEGGIGQDEAFGIAIEPGCNEIQVCGSFEDSVNFGGTTPIIANDKSAFVMASNNSGILSWVFEQVSNEDIEASSISTGGGKTSVGGQIYGDGYFSTDPLTITSWNGFEDHFVFSFDCGNLAPCSVSIDACAPDVTVVSGPTCQHTLGDYTGISVTDGCSAGGITIAQDFPFNSILGPGIHEIQLTATDGGGTKDVCFFEVVVKQNANARIAECGSTFTNETSGGAGNQYNSFSCSAASTPGQDAFYQVTVDPGVQFLQIKMTNVVDANDPFVYVYWLSDNCPSTAVCDDIDSINVATGKFSNNSEYVTFNAPAPGTYYVVIDAAVDSIEQYDISFLCTSAGIDFDISCPGDLDGDGLISSVNLSTADLTMQPCEAVHICNEILIENQTWEWMDSILFELGECYENINTATLSPDNPVNTGFVDVNGGWEANYDIGEHAITWNFNHSSGNPWGDGTGDNYDCGTHNYEFCFDADITSTCATSLGLSIGVKIGDDREKNGGLASNFFLVESADDFILQDDNPFFSYSTNALCNTATNEVPDSITSPGGTFTADPGIVFTDGSPSPTGTIDLTASSIGGPYTITYTVGLCPFTSNFIVNIFPQEDPTFNYTAAAYCQGESDPVANITGTNGGLFNGPLEIVFANNLTGEVDLSGSVAGGPYYITYTTPGPNCINLDSVQITINPEDDPSFNYNAIEHCAADANVLPVSITTGGGTFSEFTGTLVLNAGTGEVDIVSSPLGNYHVVYTTAGICPNVDSVQFNILVEDDAAFSYSSATYCQADANPVASITGTGGGTFSASGSIAFASTTTGEIDLFTSSAGGPYWIVYTTPGPACPNADSVQVTVNPEDDSTFSYPSAFICLADMNPLANITGTNGGLFTSSGGIVFTDGSPSSTGEIDILSSTIGGPYTITYTTPGPDCPNSMSVQVSIFAEDDPTILFNSTSFCQNESDPVPNVITPGGTFTGPVTFVNTTTGEIDLDASAVGGPFEIIYTSPGPECPNTDTAFITINTVDDPAFDYGNTEFCNSELLITPSINGTIGGIFTTADTSALKLDTLTGEIDLMISMPGGPYAVIYKTQGICPDSASADITLYAQPTSDAGPDQNLFFKYETELAAIDPSVGTGLWSVLSGAGSVSDLNDPAATITALENGTTVLEWVVTNGVCAIAIDEITLTVTDLFIPQALTPNGDGDNDLLIINGLEQLDNTVKIFNRWGQVVYETSNYQNDWDGTDVNGNELVSDTYFYIITASETKFKGFVVLKR